MKTVPFCQFQIKRCKQSRTQKCRQLDGVEREVGVKAQLSDVQPGPLCTSGFHMPCYRQFTDKTKIARSVKRCAKVGQPSHDSFTSKKSVRIVECSSCIKTSDQPKRKNNINALPEQCIICKAEKYTKKSYSKKRQREKLSVCEYTSGELEMN